MSIDPSNFYRINVIDTCAVWNLLSSRTLYLSAVSTGCTFSFTGFVHYECLLKPRNTATKEDEELQKRLEDERRKGRFQKYHLDIEDLQEIEILESRHKLGKGELSSIAFAKRTRQAFLTDDQSARRLASQIIEIRMVQTTPHILGWLIYDGLLSDSDKDKIIKEHEELKGKLSKYFQEIYERALHYRLLSSSNSKT